MDITNTIRTMNSTLIERMVRIRRDLHKIPEPSLKEFETSAYIFEELKGLGLDVKPSIGGTGIVVTINGQGEGRTIAIRADIDALPVQEKNEIDSKSKNDGYMHACGHDGHAAMAIGAAAILNEIKQNLKGNVKFIFQPAEEQYGGAKRMIDCGVLDNPHVDAILALHLWPDLKKGTIGLKSGCIMASNDKFEIMVKGKGGHGAMPHLCIDAMTTACQVVNGVQTFMAREIDPLDSAVVTFGTFNSGTTYNIVPNEAVLTGTVRAVNESTRRNIEMRLNEIIGNICRAYRADYKFNYIKQYPPTVNDLRLNVFLKKVAVDHVGEVNLINIDKPYMTAEDFAYFIEKVPGCMCFIGIGDDENKYPLHHEKFNFDENIMGLGATFLASAAFRYLNQEIVI